MRRANRDLMNTSLFSFVLKGLDNQGWNLANSLRIVIPMKKRISNEEDRRKTLVLGHDQIHLFAHDLKLVKVVR